MSFYRSAVVGTYRRVSIDGTLGQPTQSVSLVGYSGAVLVAEAFAEAAEMARDEAFQHLSLIHI